MALVLVWFSMLLLVGFWSLGMALLYAATAWALGQAGALSGVPDLVRALELPAWLGPWIPPELAPVATGLLGALEPLLALMIQWAPALGGGLVVLAWALWGLGLLMILLLGLALTALVLFLRRSSAGGRTADGDRGASAVRGVSLRDLARRYAGRWLKA